jgi:TRAP transporter TAXI family solute receptor
MAISRRTVFKAGAIVLATGLIGTSVTGRQDRTILIKIAGDRPDGVYPQFAELLATAINTAERGLNCQPVATDDSVDSIQLVGKGDAHIGIAMADVAVAALNGQDLFNSTPVPVKAIGRVYQSYLQLVVRHDAQLYEVADLRGKKVSLGPEGSGTAMFGRRLFNAIKLDIDEQYLSLRDATAALENGPIDALLWMGGVPTRELAELHSRAGIRLLRIEELPSNLDRYGVVYQKVTIPSGSYGEGGMPTIGVANLLVCASTLTYAIAARVARVLIKRSGDLVPPEALGTQSDDCSLIDTFGVPMHPGAASVYQGEHG